MGKSKRAPSIYERAVAWTKAHAGPMLVSAFAASLIIYSLDRRPPLELGEPRLNAKVIHPGEHVIVDWEQRWVRLCPGTVDRTLVTSHGEVRKFNSFPIYPPLKTGEIDQQSVFYVPHTIPNGVATITSTITFRCNWLNSIWPIVVKAQPVIVRVEAEG